MTTVISRIAVGAGIACMAAGANAAVLDFSIPSGGFSVTSYTDILGYDASSAITGGNITGETGFQSIKLAVDGEDIDIYIDGAGAGNPYFDADSGGPGGLGNCRNFTGTTTAQCDPNSDDNLTIAATEQLFFDFVVNGDAQGLAYFGEFLFYDDDHNAINGNIRVTHGAGLMTTIAVVGGVGDLSILGGSTFLKFNDIGDSIKADQNYYITQATVTAVPVPAAVWLFGSALGLMGWMRRKAVA